MPVGFPDYYGGLTIPVTVVEGGTGQTALTSNAVLLGNGTGNVALSNVGTANQVFQIPSGGGAPLFQSLAINAGALSGVLPIANGGTGTSSPGLIAGNQIIITGSWPDQTIAVTSTPTFTYVIYTGTRDFRIQAEGSVWNFRDLTAVDAWWVSVPALNAASPTVQIFGGVNIGASPVLQVNGAIYATFYVQVGAGSVAVGTALKIGSSGATTGFSQIGTNQGAVAGITGDLLNIADPTVAWRLALDKSGNLGLGGSIALGGATLGIGNGISTLSPAGPNKGTGSGPNSFTIVQWLQQSINGQNYWIPLCQ